MDRLVQQLLGRYNKCKLTVETGIDKYLADTLKNDCDYVTIVKENMVNALAKELIYNSNVCTIEKQVSEPGCLSERYRSTLYCFSKDNVAQLVKDCFDAGVEAAKQTD